eukprot:CAMPEP_0184863842 /NCGR_PEP_ID=MMETSP0580-20130426/12727_1 /TAXON_ID=1118495 /ORGANISM="Dactyliosolen fragilissimus" /LENGTH=1065 /DNA_ID=CAMNT_0027362409 /DNA_START=193 /DNA_END=3390 /DNA_ORIENTATION=+
MSLSHSSIHFKFESDSHENVNIQDAIHPPPPGFEMSQETVHSVLKSYGENRVGADSAPPPPGFASSRDQRNYSDSENCRRSDLHLSPRLLGEKIQRPGSCGLLHPSDLTKSAEDRSEMKTFANLAEALGKGLAESMDDSLLSGHRVHTNSLEKQDLSRQIPTTSHSKRDQNAVLQSSLYSESGGQLVRPTASSFDVEIDNFARQGRHSSRLLGPSIDGSWQYTNLSSQAEYVKGKIPIAEREANEMGGRYTTGSPYSTTYGKSTISSINPHVYPSYPGQSITIMEPSSRPPSALTPSSELNETSACNADSRVQVNQNEVDFSLDKKHNKGHLLQILEGRASAPPQVFDLSSGESKPSTSALTFQTTSSLQKRAAEIRDFRAENNQHLLNQSYSKSSTPKPSFSNSASTYMAKRMTSPSPPCTTENNLDVNNFQKGMEELLPFVCAVPQNSPHASDPDRESSQRWPGRTLAIVFCSTLHIPDVRSTCEAFGSLLYFRSDFCRSHGIIFVGYHDMRSACHAANELKVCLQNVTTSSYAGRSSENSSYGKDNLNVMYCVSLNSSACTSDSSIIIANLPNEVDEKTISNFMSMYGAVRSIQTENNQPVTNLIRKKFYNIEFYDIQDANQALLEIEGTRPWGPDVSVSMENRSASERKKGHELLALLGRWRQCNTVDQYTNGKLNLPIQSIISAREVSPALTSNSSSPMPQNPDENIFPSSRKPRSSAAPPSPSVDASHESTSQIFIGPDGQYSYVIMNPNPHGSSNHQTNSYSSNAPIIPPVQHSQQHIFHSPHVAYLSSGPIPMAGYPNGQEYWMHPHQGHVSSAPHAVPAYHHVTDGNIIASPQYIHMHSGRHAPMYRTIVPLDNNVRATDSSLSSGASSGKNILNRNVNEEHITQDRSTSLKEPSLNLCKNAGCAEETHQLALDIEDVRKGSDTRTSLMIRNIPNKYTQKMLLSELMESGHGSEKIDFFYLPIDFKNKCNRGYAFVNFVDYNDIVSFHKQYHGKSWKVYNSDKICDISYARIQGKSGMLKRFQNSALMDKDVEYRPLVFVSHGANKGKLEEFPVLP